MTTASIVISGFSMPTVKVKMPKIQVKIPEMVAPVFISDGTPSAVITTEEADYSDEQFYADLRKASKKLDLMEAKALEEYAHRKARNRQV